MGETAAMKRCAQCHGKLGLGVRNARSSLGVSNAFTVVQKIALTAIVDQADNSTERPDRVSAPTRRCRIDGPGFAITRVGWARHGQENYYAPTAGDSNRRPGLATTHGVRARHDQLTNAALAALFGTGPADTTVKESPGGGMPGLPRS